MTQAVEVGNQPVKFTAINVYLAESLYNAEPSHFGRHRIKKMSIRSKKDTRNRKSKTIRTLPQSFAGVINTPGTLGNINTDIYTEGDVFLKDRIIEQQLQFVVLTEETTYHTERTPLFFTSNEQLNDLKEWCREVFPDSSVFIDSLVTETEYNGQTYITEWERGKIINGSNVMGLRLVKINDTNFDEMDLEELKEIIGKFELDDGVNVGEGLMDDLCKYEFATHSGWERACHI